MKVAIGLTAAAAAALLGSAANAETLACGKPMTTDQKLQRVLDITEITNVASAHAYYHGATLHRDEIEKVWSKRDDIAWTNNTDRYSTRKSFWAFYVDNLENFPTKGAMWYHMLTTPMIEVAGDGKTARAIFMSFGNVSGVMKPGEPEAQWTQEKYGMDFIREDGAWKIWRLRTFVDFYTPVGKSWLNAGDNIAAVDTLAMDGKNPDGSMKASVQKEAGATFFNVKPDEKKQFYRAYTTDREPELMPAPPKAYCSYSELEPF